MILIKPMQTTKNLALSSAQQPLSLLQIKDTNAEAPSPALEGRHGLRRHALGLRVHAGRMAPGRNGWRLCWKKWEPKMLSKMWSVRRSGICDNLNLQTFKCSIASIWNVTSKLKHLKTCRLSDASRWKYIANSHQIHQLKAEISQQWETIQIPSPML